MPALVTCVVRVFAACFLLVLAAAGAAQGQTVAQCVAKENPALPFYGIKTKKIRIFNNSPSTLWAVILRARAPFDEWMVGLCQLGKGTENIKFPTTLDYRLYVGGIDGIGPSQAVEVTVPWYTRLKDNPTGMGNDEFIDWFNGNRVLFYEAQTKDVAADGNYKQIFNDWTADQSNVLPAQGQPGGLKTPAPCATSISDRVVGACTALPVVATTRNIPDHDRYQLMEHTFSNAVTKDGRPFKIVDGVGYNISSVDQVYLPVAMQVLAASNTIGYIGTTVDLTTFRTKLNAFAAGWPQYARDPNDPATFTPPPRIPGAYNVFLNEFGQPHSPYASNGVLTPDCKSDASGCPAIANMKTLYNTCKASTDGICQFYKPVIDLFLQNYDDYHAMSCADKTILNDDISVMKRIYGWVPFNDVCNLTNAKVNDLSLTTPPAGFTFTQLRDQFYTHELQTNSPGHSFNPYVGLIHDKDKLAMQAYAFSIDDVIGFQSYPGDGIIITLAGCQGLDPCTELDTSKKIVVNMGTVMPGVPEWNSWGPCSNEVSKDFDPAFASALFYAPKAPTPQSPCVFTATDTAGKKYQLFITQGPSKDPPQNVAVDTVCASVTQPQFQNWCKSAKINPPNNINTPPIIANVSTHDFDANTTSLSNGFSDILWLNNATGKVVVWPQNVGTIYPPGAGCTPVGTPPPTINPTTCGPSPGSVNPTQWAIVGQRDFNGDGRTDILFRSTVGGPGVFQQILIWLIDAQVDANRFTIGTTVGGGGSPGSVTSDWLVAGTGDFDHDGNGDILFFDEATGQVVIWLIDKNTLSVKSDTSGSPGTINLAQGWKLEGIGDFNGDGFADILWRNTNDGQVLVWTLNGASIFIPPTGSFLAGSGSPGFMPSPWIVAGTGDFNGDGKYDILWFNPTTGEQKIWLLNGGNTRLVETAILVDGAPVNLADWTILATGDYNRDGKSDILWQNNATGDMLVWTLAFNLGDPTHVPPIQPFIFRNDAFPHVDQSGWKPDTAAWKPQVINAD